MKAPKKLSVSVRREHIQRGVVMSFTRCPIARAIKEKYGDRPYVYRSLVSICFGKEFVIYTLPLAARKFIADFDGGVDRAKIKPLKLTAKINLSLLAEIAPVRAALDRVSPIHKN